MIPPKGCACAMKGNFHSPFRKASTRLVGHLKFLTILPPGSLYAQVDPIQPRLRRSYLAGHPNYQGNLHLVSRYVNRENSPLHLTFKVAESAIFLLVLIHNSMNLFAGQPGLTRNRHWEYRFARLIERPCCCTGRSWTNL